MDFITALLLGLAAAVAATWFPGLLNMNSVSVTLRAGRRAGYVFGVGMTVAFTTQAALAVFFASYFAAHPRILTFMRQWAVLVLLVLAAFFLVKGFRAQLQHEGPESKPYHGSAFVRGIALALMNFLTVPYFFAVCGWLLSDGYLQSDFGSRTGFTLGAGTGAMLIFGAYTRCARWMQRRAHFLTRNINFVLGGILILLALVQAIRMYR
ncbi:LysE family transporter [Neolewinella sp.]|uniref:LysE family transporter n=1 Tax=Neolewinella sp. TaxID=2993543 RepID=UPI003B5222DD